MISIMDSSGRLRVIIVCLQALFLFQTSQSTPDTNENTEQTPISKPTPQPYLVDSHRDLLKHNRLRAGIIDVEKLEHLPRMLGIKSIFENGFEKYEKEPFTEEVEVLYNLLVIRCRAKNGADEVDNLIKGFKQQGEAIKYISQTRAMLLKIKQLIRRKIVILISAEELLYKERWKHPLSKNQSNGKQNNPQNGEVILSAYFDRLAKYIPKLGFSGAIFELPTVFEVIHWKSPDDKLAPNEMYESKIIEFMKAMTALGQKLKDEPAAKGRIFGVKASDSTLLAHKILLANKALMNGFKDQVNFYFLKFLKVKRIKDHLWIRYYNGKPQAQIPRHLRYLIEPPRSPLNVKAEIDLLLECSYPAEKIVMIISTDVIKFPHNWAGENLMKSSLFNQKYVYEFCDQKSEDADASHRKQFKISEGSQIVKVDSRYTGELKTDQGRMGFNGRGYYGFIEQRKKLSPSKTKTPSMEPRSPLKLKNIRRIKEKVSEKLQRLNRFTSFRNPRAKRSVDSDINHKIRKIPGEYDEASQKMVRNMYVLYTDERYPDTQKVTLVSIAYDDADKITSQSTPDTNENTEQTPISKPTPQPYLVDSHRDLLKHNRLRAGIIDVEKLEHLPRMLGIKSTFENGFEKYEKEPFTEEVEVLYNLLVIRCRAKNGADEVDNLIKGFKQQGEAIKYISQTRAMLLKIKQLIRRKIVILISAEELLYKERWKHPLSKNQSNGKQNNPQNGEVILSAYFDRLAKYIPKLGFSGAIFELPTVFEVIHWKSPDDKLAPNEMYESKIIEFMKAMTALGQKLKDEPAAKGRIFGVKASDSTLLAHKILLANKALMNGFKDQVNFYFLKFLKVKRIKDHLWIRYYNGKPQTQIPRHLRYLIEPPRSPLNVKAEIDLLLECSYPAEKIVMIISTDVIKFPHNWAGENLMKSSLFNQKYVYEFCDQKSEDADASHRKQFKISEGSQIVKVDSRYTGELKTDQGRMGFNGRGYYGFIEQRKKLSPSKTKIPSMEPRSPRKLKNIRRIKEKVSEKLQRLNRFTSFRNPRAKRSVDSDINHKIRKIPGEYDEASQKMVRNMYVLYTDERYPDTQKVTLVSIAYDDADKIIAFIFGKGQKGQRIRDVGKELGGAAIFTVQSDGMCQGKTLILSKAVFDKFKEETVVDYKNAHDILEEEKDKWAQEIEALESTWRDDDTVAHEELEELKDPQQIKEAKLDGER
ncbi:hypothetical protein Ddc_08260 [Ditylenchus destructor]|nr:hypothetical protein Ddc_08260 [Ditylenchus destructor]